MLHIIYPLHTMDIDEHFSLSLFSFKALYRIHSFTMYFPIFNRCIQAINLKHAR